MDDDLRLYLEGKDPEWPDRSDLVGQWDLVPDDENRRLGREGLVLRYWTYSFRHRWAWDAMAELLRTLRLRNEPKPPALIWWAFDAAAGRVRPISSVPGDGRRPPARVGRPAKYDRDIRIYWTFVELRRRGVSRKRAIEKIGRTIHLSSKGVASVLDKMKKTMASLQD